MKVDPDTESGPYERVSQQKSQTQDRASDRLQCRLPKFLSSRGRRGPKQIPGQEKSDHHGLISWQQNHESTRWKSLPRFSGHLFSCDPVGTTLEDFRKTVETESNGQGWIRPSKGENQQIYNQPLPAALELG
ncbi:MAG: hypothetical protein WBE58_06270 [Verrucomicrobiales bacterium]